MKSNGMTFPCKPQSSMHHNGFAKCALPGLTLLQGLAHCHFWQRRKKIKICSCGDYWKHFSNISQVQLSPIIPQSYVSTNRFKQHGLQAFSGKLLFFSFSKVCFRFPIHQKQKLVVLQRIPMCIMLLFRSPGIQHIWSDFFFQISRTSKVFPNFEGFPVLKNASNKETEDFTGKTLQFKLNQLRKVFSDIRNVLTKNK